LHWGALARRQMAKEASAHQELLQVTLGNNQSFSGLTATNSANIIAGNVRDVNIHTSNSKLLLLS